MPLNRFPWADTTIVELDPPYRLVEQGRAGKYNRIKVNTEYRTARGRRRHHPGRADERDRARAGHRPAAGDARLRAAGCGGRTGAPCGACRPSSRTATYGAAEPRSPADRMRIRMPHLVSRTLPLALLAVAAVLVLCGLRQQAQDQHRGRHRGHVPQRRPADVPGPDLAAAQPERHRGPDLPAGHPARQAKLGRRARPGSASSSGSRTTRPDAACRRERVRHHRHPGRHVHPRCRRPPQNPFTYKAGLMPPNGLVRRPERGWRRRASIQGSLVLFKLPVAALENRPLELASPTSPRTRAPSSLDV